MLPAVTVGLMLVSLTCGENPAVQVVLTNKGLQYGKAIRGGVTRSVKFIQTQKIIDSGLDWVFS